MALPTLKDIKHSLSASKLAAKIVKHEERGGHGSVQSDPIGHPGQPVIVGPDGKQLPWYQAGGE